MAETWREIKLELEQENVRPVTPDTEYLNEITKILDERTNGVASAQVMKPIDCLLFSGGRK